MTTHQEQVVTGKFQYLIFSPKGSVEGVLLRGARELSQIVFDRHDEATAEDFGQLRTDQKVSVRARLQGPSAKGASEHAVFSYVRLVSVDGRKPGKRSAAAAPSATGRVTRLNYARHGAPNGVVLNTGDFVHTRPEGFAGLKLKVGDKVRAEGESRPMKVGAGRVVEAVRVNGRRVKA